MRTKDPKKIEALIKKRRKQILGAALSVFSKKGFARTGMDEIALRAKLAKGTIYHYFKSKEALFLSVIDEGMENLEGLMLNTIKKENDPVKKIEEAIRTYLLFFQKNKDLIGVLTHERSEFRRRVKQKYLEHCYEHINKMEEIFRQGIRQGLLKKVDVRSAVAMLADIVNASIYMWALEGASYPLIDKLPIILKIYFTGILKDEKRRKAYT
ncbi:MAG: TetR/AcrR family transcriptional regulator [Euryarchaeota archaeon]|nr:TetR/AcrR family transcriptional regulator [Euryarchaeota archaeon]